MPPSDWASVGTLFILVQIIKMYSESLKTIVLCLSAVAAAARVPYALRDADPGFVAVAPTAGEVQQQLGPQLSSGATMYFPASEEYDDATSRWNIYGQPNISVVVEVATADDVASVVKYANTAELPFIAINRGHGSPYTLSGVQNGIQIWMNKLTDITLSEDGKSAVMGGGVYVEQVISVLAQHGKASGELPIYHIVHIESLSPSDLFQQQVEHADALETSVPASGEDMVACRASLGSYWTTSYPWTWSSGTAHR